MANIRSSIQASNDRFASFLAKGDAGGLASLYNAGARILPPDAPMMSSSEDIKAYWQSAIDSGVKEGQLETLDVEEFGDNLGREIGQFVLQIQQGEGMITERGKYVIIWRQDDSGWKIDVDIWNFTLSA